MKKMITPRTQAALIAAAIISSGACLQAQYSTPNSAGRPADTASRQDQKFTNTTISASAGQPMKVNRASSLIGSTVKNQQGDKLGKIHDVVIDLNSDRVSYVVLATDAGLLQAERLHAVPLRAFQASADGSSLTLNAEKDSLARSEGFDKNAWPNLNTATWGAQPFWKDTQGSQDTNQQSRVNGQNITPSDSTAPKDSTINKNTIDRKETEPRPQP